MVVQFWWYNSGPSILMENVDQKVYVCDEHQAPEKRFVNQRTLFGW